MGYLGADGSIIKRDLKKNRVCEGLDWIELAHNRVQWWGFVNTVMNLRVP
jgi:hypothetical protein